MATWTQQQNTTVAVITYAIDAGRTGSYLYRTTQSLNVILKKNVDCKENVSSCICFNLLFRPLFSVENRPQQSERKTRKQTSTELNCAPVSVMGILHTICSPPHNHPTGSIITCKSEGKVIEQTPS